MFKKMLQKISDAPESCSQRNDFKNNSKKKQKKKKETSGQTHLLDDKC